MLELRTLWEKALGNKIKKKKLRRSDPSICQQELIDFRRDRKELSRAIKIAKEEACKSLCDQAEREPWGIPYKLVMGELLTRTPTPGLNTEGKVRNVIQSLFPEH